MSEYNNFLKHFNRLKNKGEGSEREDIIPIKPQNASEVQDKQDTADTVPVQQEVSPDIAEEKEAEVISPAQNSSEGDTVSDESATEEKDEVSDSIPARRFIKTNSTPFISVNDKTESQIPTEVEKYTDRLKVNQPVRKKKTGYTGKINTYDANHSPLAGTPKFITVDNETKREALENTSLKQTPEKTAESQTKIIPTVIEKKENVIGEPKVILEKLPDSAPSDKTKVINSKGSLLREIAKTSGNLTDEDANQLAMDGFAGNSAEGASAETEILEKELSEVREKRMNDFNYWSEEKSLTGESEDKSISASDEKTLPGFLSFFQEKFGHLDTDFVPVGNEEYTDPTRRKEIFSRLISIRKGLIIKTAVTGLLGIILLLMNIITTLSAAMNNGFFRVFGSSTVIYNSINLFILVLTAILMFDDLKKGFFSILKLRPRTDSVLLAVFTGALAQNIAAYFTLLKSESDFHLITCAAVLLCVPVLIAKIFYCDSTRHCFKAAAATSDKSYLRTISDENIITNLLKDRSNTETKVVYAGKTRFISDFLSKCAGGAFSAQASSRAVAIAMSGAIIAFIVSLVTSGSMTFALGCFTLCAAMGFPVSSLVFTGFMLASENKSLSVKSSFISSFSDAHSFCNIDDLILSGSDIFSAEITDVTCNRNVAKKQAEFCAAVLTSSTDGILKKAFSKFSDGLEDRFPETEGFCYEHKLGLSAWISDCKVLLGTKDYLISHNVQLPDENSVPFMLGENIKPLFLAIEGHFAAVFSVRYTCNDLAAKSLKELTSNGANILIGIEDPNITEEFAEKILSLPENSLRIIKNDVYESFLTQKNTVTDSENTGIVFTDSFDSFCRTMAGAIKLEKIKKVSKLLCEAGMLAGTLFTLILVFTSAAGIINSWIAIILQLLWILAGFIVTPMLANIPIAAGNNFAGSITSGIKNVSDTVKTSADSRASRRKTDSYEDIFADTSEDKGGNITETVFPDKKKAGPVVSFEAPLTEEAEAKPAEQLIMQGAPYTEPPEVIDFNKITGKEEYTSDESEKQTVSDDLLDMYAETPSRRQKHISPVQKNTGKQGLFGRLSAYVRSDDGEDDSDDLFNSQKEAPSRVQKQSSPEPRNDSRQGLLGRLSAYAQADDNEEDSDIFGSEKPKKSLGRSILSFAEEKIPAPPRFESPEKRKEKENDPLNARFVPPETDIPSQLYKDDYFSSFDTKEDDKTFSALRKDRAKKEVDNDFWSDFE